MAKRSAQKFDPPKPPKRPKTMRIWCRTNGCNKRTIMRLGPVPPRMSVEARVIEEMTFLGIKSACVESKAFPGRWPSLIVEVHSGGVVAKHWAEVIADISQADPKVMRDQIKEAEQLSGWTDPVKPEDEADFWEFKK